MPPLPCKISIAKLNIIFNPGYPGRKKENMKIYKNYGCLSAEKRIVYTYGAVEPTAVTYEEIEVQLPEGWKEAENNMGSTIIVSPEGDVFLPNKILCGNECPCLQWIDANKHDRRIKLKVLD